MRPFYFFILTVIAGLVFPVLSGLMPAVPAADLWIADTRQADLPAAESLPDTFDYTQIRFSRLQEDETSYEWKASSAEEFIETHKPDKPLVVIIHGNLMTYPEIFRYAYRFKQLAGNYAENYGKDYTDCRLVFWSWHSDRTGLKIRQDALLKRQRADGEARILAACLLHLPENSKVSLAGFSFGAKLVCCTLQQLATIEETTGGKTIKPRLQLRAVLLAAAMNQSSLLPNHRYGNALDIAESMLIHINAADDTLCWYPLLTGIGGPKAVGKEGAFTGSISAENKEKITSKNVAGLIGREHGFMNSLRALLAVQGDFQRYCLFE